MPWKRQKNWACSCPSMTKIPILPDLPGDMSLPPAPKRFPRLWHVPSSGIRPRYPKKPSQCLPRRKKRACRYMPGTCAICPGTSGRNAGIFLLSSQAEPILPPAGWQDFLMWTCCGPRYMTPFLSLHMNGITNISEKISAQTYRPSLPTNPAWARAPMESCLFPSGLPMNSKNATATISRTAFPAFLWTWRETAFPGPRRRCALIILTPFTNYG